MISNSTVVTIVPTVISEIQTFIILIIIMTKARNQFRKIAKKRHMLNIVDHTWKHLKMEDPGSIVKNNVQEIQIAEFGNST